MKKGLSFLSGAGLGAALMYIMDPRSGDRRRSLVRDQMVHVVSQAGNAVEPTAEDLRNRTYGLAAETKARLFSKGDASDNVLNARVRSTIGRHSSHPGSIAVDVNDGRVTLRGPVLTDEIDELLRAVSSTRGVQDVENRLEPHQTPDDIPGLQGRHVPRGGKPELLQEVWSPTARLLVGTAGAALTFVGSRIGGLFGAVLGSVGIGASARAVTNKPLKRLVGIDAGLHAVAVQKTININAPVEEVYRFWSNFENFPRFMSHINEIEDLGNGRSLWKVEGPAGTTTSWTAIMTENVPNEKIAWRTEEGSAVAHGGAVHFTPNQKGGTQVHVRMTYNPPAGAMGHTLARVLGSDPESQMHDDLVRFKSLIEVGKTTADGETVTRDEVTG